MKTVLVLAVLLWAGAGRAFALELKSPDGRLTLTFDLRDFGTDRACPFYRVACDGRDVLKDSRLGLDLGPARPGGGMSLAGKVRGSHDSTWKPLCGERDGVRDHYNQMAVDLKENDALHRLLRLTFRAYDEGIAFCYTVPAQEALKQFTITSERTRFSFTADHTTWAEPADHKSRLRAGGVVEVEGVVACAADQGDQVPGQGGVQVERVPAVARLDHIAHHRLGRREVEAVARATADQ
ncbi:MAG TPA: glycoside hydrolase family 97 N-terminal domain-containing protein [Tepidisphaeraceae bacterium]|jgi:hypothetical protein